MSAGGVVVYRTPLEDDARAMGDLLAESGIGSEVRVLPGEDGADEAVLLVPAGAEEAAVNLIAESLEGRGLRPEEGTAASTGHAVCPNCAAPAPAAAGDACRECGYAVQPSAGEPARRVRDAFPDARTLCADCCAPYAKDAGECADCGGPLEPIDRDDPVCPAEAHVLVKGEAPGWVCPGCRTAWLAA